MENYNEFQNYKPSNKIKMIMEWNSENLKEVLGKVTEDLSGSTLFNGECPNFKLIAYCENWNGGNCIELTFRDNVTDDVLVNIEINENTKAIGVTTFSKCDNAMFGMIIIPILECFFGYSFHHVKGNC